MTPFGFFAAAAAFSDPACEAWRLRLVEYIRANHDYAIARLSAVPGLRMTAPESSYLLWVDASRCPALSNMKAHSIAGHLLEAGVGVSDGKDFGASAACFRLNVACARRTLERGLARIVATLEQPTNAQH